MQDTYTMDTAPENELDFGSDQESEGEMTPPRPVKFLDEDESSDDDETAVVKKKIMKKNNIEAKIFEERLITDYIFADANSYNFRSWRESFPDNKVRLRALIFNPAWYEFFDIVEKKPYFKGMERILSAHLQKNEQTIVPHAELVFNTLNILSPKKIKVVLIGQDPYPGATKINGKYVPQAMGVSFSVPLNYQKPPSLKNIYENMVEFGHLKKIPNSGCLAGLVMQGFFMINAAFTTFFGKCDAHKDIWKNFTDDLLAYINNKCKNIVFMVWGRNAHLLCLNIDPHKHHIITTSHPSPLAYNKTFTGFAYGPTKNPRERKTVSYPTFHSTDHFGRMNNYLESVGKKQIFLDIIDV